MVLLSKICFNATNKLVSADLNFVWASFAGVTQILKERNESGVKLSNEVAGLFSLIFEIALS